MSVILASSSPRRKELLKLILPSFEVIPSMVNEVLPMGIKAENSPEYLAVQKAKCVSSEHFKDIVIGSDTSVIINHKIFGKPKDESNAFSMLRELSGNTHKVITGCAVISNGILESFSVTTEVEFYALTDSEIMSYIKTQEPFDKAGSYGIQGRGGLFVKAINGDYNNVVGLPLGELRQHLKKFKNLNMF